MSALDLIYLLLAGGMLGMLGQVVRMCAGLKKANDSASASGQSFADMFDGGKLAISLVIGFAGACAGVAEAPGGPTSAARLPSSSIYHCLLLCYLLKNSVPMRLLNRIR